MKQNFKSAKLMGVTLMSQMTDKDCLISCIGKLEGIDIVNHQHLRSKTTKQLILERPLLLQNVNRSISKLIRTKKIIEKALANN